MESPQVVRTQNKEQDTTTRWLESHIQTLIREGETVRFVTDGRVITSPNEDISGQTSGPDDLLSTFTLPVGGKFHTAPDGHGGIGFTVSALHEDKVIIEYKSTFYHMDFGPNMITEDTGTIELPYR